MYVTTQAQFDKAIADCEATVTIVAPDLLTPAVVVGDTGATVVRATGLARVHAVNGAVIHAHGNSWVYGMAGSVAHLFDCARGDAGPGATVFSHSAYTLAVDISTRKNPARIVCSADYSDEKFLRTPQWELDRLAAARQARVFARARAAARRAA